MSGSNTICAELGRVAATYRGRVIAAPRRGSSAAAALLRQRYQDQHRTRPCGLPGASKLARRPDHAPAMRHRRRAAATGCRPYSWSSAIRRILGQLSMVVWCRNDHVGDIPDPAALGPQAGLVVRGPSVGGSSHCQADRDRHLPPQDGHRGSGVGFRPLLPYQDGWRGAGILPHTEQRQNP
jgi:hypothetical protein